ncbi:MAG: hypothetical protein HY958_11970 [Bacteroidia bacterium]|nr:hypothetical protein [Bacteroidia bacterium]
MRSDISKPVLFNCFKHHCGYIISEISSVRNEADFDTIISKLSQIGNSVTDLYTGVLNPEEISLQIVSRLQTEHHFSENSYFKWINDNSSLYQIMEISDKSTWTLRLGNLKERYIHIHPARYSEHSFRVNALSLKTAIAVHCATKIYNYNPFDLEMINKIRKQKLSASPVKSVSPNTGLGKIISIFDKIL